MTNNADENLKLGVQIFWSRILESIGIYDLYDLTVRTIEADYFVGVDKKSKQSYIFPYSCINKTVFFNRDKALKKLKETEKTKKKVSNESYYEEY